MSGIGGGGEGVESLGAGMGNITCAQALMWVLHFVGDVAQPLHASGLGAGGNTVRVKFGGVETGLHHVRSSSQSRLRYELLIVFLDV
jgi:hypothetical protein